MTVRKIVRRSQSEKLMVSPEKQNEIGKGRHFSSWLFEA